MVLDTGAITEALNSQFHPQNTRFAEVPSVPDEFLDMFYAANREIHILREVEQELFNALVINADPIVGQQRLDAYLEWGNDGIERGLVHIVEGSGTNYQVISQPNTEWLLGGSGIIIPDFPTSLPNGSIPSNHADNAINLYVNSRNDFNLDTLTVSTDRSNVFDRDLQWCIQEIFCLFININVWQFMNVKRK